MGFAGRTSRRWQRVLGAATATCAAALGGVALAHPKTPAPRAYRWLHTIHDGEDVAGPLDLVTATAGQEGDDLALEVRTAGTWTPEALGADPRRSLCFLIAQPSAPNLRVCLRYRPASRRLAVHRAGAPGAGPGPASEGGPA